MRSMDVAEEPAPAKSPWQAVGRAIFVQAEAIGDLPGICARSGL